MNVPRRARLAYLCLLLGAPAHAWNGHLALGLDGAGGTRLAAALALPLPQERRLNIDGERQDNGSDQRWDRIRLSLEDDPAAPLQQDAALTWEDAAGALERLGLGTGLTLAGNAWVMRAGGTLERLWLRLARPLRPFTAQDILELTALEAHLGVDYYGTAWSLHFTHRRRDHSRDLGLLSRRPDLALRLFTPSAVNAGYTLEAQAWEAGLIHYRPHTRLGLWWQRSVSAVDGAALDTLTLTLTRGPLTLDLGYTPALGTQGLFLQTGLDLGP